MYRNLVGLAFTNVYTGVITTQVAVSDDIYHAIKIPDGLRAWYFDHSNGDGALWISTAGRHAEPITEWLHDAQRRFECTSMLAAVVDNGGEIPPEDAYTFAISRDALDCDGVQRLAAFGCYTIYLPHADEFRLIVPELAQWKAMRRSFDAVPKVYTELIRRGEVNLGDATSSSGKPGAYDPILAQVNEVMVQMSRTTATAIDRLTGTWQETWPPIPGDINGLQSDLSEEEERIKAELSSVRVNSAERDAVLSDVDRFARILAKTRRIASEVERKLVQVNPAPSRRATYEQVATPMMLRAIERYTTDVARRLNLSGYVFVPVIGEQFAVKTKLFPHPWESEEQTYDLRSAVVEIPEETRLRLGAMPMLAREVAWMMDDDINRIIRCLRELRSKGDPWAERILPPPPQKQEERDRYEKLVTQLGREIAADLIAAAAAGPQYVFAMARFVVGTLSQSELAGLRAEKRLEFRARISTCLALLREIGTPAEFTSVYLPSTEMHLPAELLATLKTVVPHKFDPQDIDEVAELLYAGKVVDARPLTILSALWRAVVARGRYVNEVAALVSVAAAT